MTPTPPRMPRWLLSRIAPPDKRAFVLGDLEEAFRTRARTDVPRAQRWYRRQAILSALVLLGSRLRSRPISRNDMSIQTLIYDARHGIRGLRLDPLFTAAALATLALGIGGTVALFSVVRAVLLEPPIYEAPEQIVNLFETRASRPREPGGMYPGLSNMSYPDVMDVRDRSRTLSGVAARQSWTPTLLGAGDPVRLTGGSVSAAFFNILGVQPVVGRVFDEGDGAPGHTPVVVISHGLWTDRFGADELLIGRSLDLSGTAYVVVGIIPADFEDTDGRNVIWRADPPHFDVNVLGRTGHSYRPTARIAPGFTIDDVNRELEQINADLVRQYPEKTGDGMLAVPVMDVLVGESRSAILLLFGAVALLLIIACANVANLLLGRASVRRREMAVRTALGASPRRLAAQLLTESVVLAVVGGVGGIVLAQATVPLFVSMTEAIPRANRIAIDPTVVAFAVVLTLCVGMGFGFAPAWFAGRHAPVDHLRDGQRSLDSGGGFALRNALVVAELSLSLMLLTGAGLLIRSFWTLQSVDKGLRTEQVLTMNVIPSGTNWPKHGDLTRYWDQVVERVSALPGVRSAAAVSFLPLSGGYEGQGVRRADRPRPEPGQAMGSEARAVTPEYFRTIGISLIRGRALTGADDSASTGVIVINEALVDMMFPGEDPLGKAIIVQGEPFEVVGIVGNVRQFGVQSPARPEMYAPHAQPFVPWIRQSMDLVVHSAIEPQSIATAVRQAVWSVDDTAPITDVKTLERWANEDVSGPRFRTVLVGVFASTALVLAMVGITGVLSHAVNSRRQEFGVRAALGATRADMIRIVVIQGGQLIGISVGIGIAASFIGARFLRSVLFGVGVADPLTFSLVTTGVVVLSLGAMLAPAFRAGRVSPMVAMRAD